MAGKHLVTNLALALHTVKFALVDICEHLRAVIALYAFWQLALRLMDLDFRLAVEALVARITVTANFVVLK